MIAAHARRILIAVARLSKIASCHPVAALTIAVLAGTSGGCASLLDLPSDPHVAEGEGEAAGLNAGVPAREPESDSLGGDGSEENSGGDTGSASGAEVTGANSGVTNALGSMVPTSGSSSSSNPGSAPTAAEAETDEPASQAVDAGSDARAPASEDPVPPDPPLVACAQGETLGPRGTCYFVVPRPLSWVIARQNCIGRGAGWDLGSIRSAADNRAVGGLITEETWMGGSDADAEGAWFWVIDDTPFWRGAALGSAVNGAFETWNPDEPNGGASSDCARAVPDTPPRVTGPTWADFECEELLASLCEGPALPR